MKTLAQLLPELDGARVVGTPAALDIARVHSDSRSLQPGDLFVALRGDRFDANDYLAQARTDGAVAALAERGLEAAGLPGVEVADSRAALGELARRWRAQFTLSLIAVTGSNGKTTVTQMIASILRAAVGDAALATRGNFNNDIGVPLTVLRLDAAHQLAVVELGTDPCRARQKNQSAPAQSRAGARCATPCCRARPASALASRAHAALRPLQGQGRCGRRCRRP